MEKEILRVCHIWKKYDRKTVLEDVNFSVREGEIFFILGPSGCGKTTLLRIIAGFTPPDRGKIFLENKDITNFPPNERKIGMVFQNYALWPHMKVVENISYGLEIRKFPQEIIEKKVEKILKITKLEEFKNTYPAKLSGGQQQRVALARGIVIEPKLLLLDEPLSNLDANLREEMRREIKRIQKETGITMIYVTHDQKEAMALGSRIGVMNEGKIIQTGNPEQLYYHPENKFVALFFGDINILEGEVEGIDKGKLKVITEEGKFFIKTEKEVFSGEEIEIGFRPESVKLKKGENLLKGKIREKEYLGEITKLNVITERGNNFILTFLSDSVYNLNVGEKIEFTVEPEKFLIFKK